MIQLAYFSSAIRLFSEQELKSLLNQARTKNNKLNITGMLVYHDGAFVQFLEGEAKYVHKLYDRIQKDARHKGIIKLSEVTIEQRIFQDWDMAFMKVHQAELEKFPSLKKVLTQADSKVAINDLVDTFLTLATYR